MASENKAILIGRAYDMRVNHTNNGNKTLSFNISMEEKLGEKKNYTSLWVNCYSGLADVLERYWVEGRLMYVEGRINVYEDPQMGNKKWSIMAKTIKFLGDGNE